MDVVSALHERHACRAFLDREVSHATIAELLDAARLAPSGVNTQPWDVVVLQGEAKAALQAQLEAAFRAGTPSSMDYAYYPDEWQEPYRSRRKACGLQLYSSLGITREDRERQTDQWAANYRAFDAPVMLLFFLSDALDQGSFIDYGMFLQSLMLCATAGGLATCPQAALGEYPDIVRRYLGRDSSDILLCGMALGYEDPDAAVNRYRTEREPVATFAQFLD